MARKRKKPSKYVRWGLTTAAVGVVGWQLAEAYLDHYAGHAAAMEMVNFFGAMGELPPEAQALWMFKSLGLAVALGGLGLAVLGLVRR
ncbi:MAG: hypothetical protein ACOCWR_04490 [Oceanidesulfovibrio sp.]